MISGHAELLRGSPATPHAARAHAEEIGTAAARAARLTHQLLAYSRGQVLAPQALDLGDVIDQLSGMLQRIIGEDVRLVSRRAPGAMPVRVDRGQIEQVILNLAVNARDAMPGGGTLILETAGLDAREAQAFAGSAAEVPPGALVCLSVKDTGVGMSADVLRQAFDPFFTTKEQGKGTGLGLSTVYGIVRQSGGAVWIESAPLAGTTVRVCLPSLTSGAEEPVCVPMPQAPARGGGTVLVVEDEPNVRGLIARILEDAGYAVLEAEDGERGLEIARDTSAPIDLVVTDVVMPRMGGRELVTRLAVERPGLRALLVSGYACGTQDEAEPLEAAIGYLPKPFTPASLLERVGACIAGSHPEPLQATLS